MGQWGVGYCRLGGTVDGGTVDWGYCRLGVL